MRKNYNTIFSAFIFLTLMTPPTNSQIVLLDTVRTTTSSIAWPSFCNNNFAWYEGSEVVQRYNGNYDTLFVDPIYEDCNVWSGLYITDNDVLWGHEGLFDPSCKHTFTWEARTGFTGGNVNEDEFGILDVYQTNKNIMLVRQNNSTFIFDIDAETFTPLNNLTTATASYKVGATASIIGDKMWNDASKYDLVTNQYLGSAIILITLSTGMVEEAYVSSNELHFTPTDYPDQIAFKESLPDGTIDIYYYNNTLHFVDNVDFSSFSTFNNGVVYLDSDQLIYWKADGSSIQLHPDANILDQSGCFIAYHFGDFSSFPFVNTELFITNGTDTESFHLDGSLSIHEFTLQGSEFLAVLTDRAPAVDVYRLIKGRHNLSCPNLCPDDDAFAEDWNSANFLFTKTMESIATIPSSINTKYEASDWILLSETFEVMPGALFEAEIIACP